MRTMARLILTADDSPSIRLLMKLTLTAEGYEVMQASDGVEALEIARHHEAALVLTDINMPRLDGFGFIEAVRKDAKRRGTPVLVLTTEVDAEKKLRAKDAGATGWIVKPFDPVKLVAAIRRVTA